MHQEPLITVVMTSYNAGKYLSIAVTSLLNQTFPRWQLILVDNGSTDDSVSSLELTDTRIHVIRCTTNIGRTQALQLALKEVRTPFTAILDADDIAHPDRFSKQLFALESSSDIVLVGSHVSLLIDDDTYRQRVNEATGVISHDRLAERNPFVHSSVMFRTDAALQVGGYDESYPYAQDFDLFQRLATIGRCLILQSQLTGLRVHKRSMTRRRDSIMLRLNDERRLFLLASIRLKLSARGVQLNRRRRALVYLEIAYHEILDGHIARGLRSFASSITIDPTLSWVLYLLRGRPSPFVG